MELYPFSLILAVVTASASIFLGFLPTKSVPSSYFTEETLKVALAWILIAFLCPSVIRHYPLIYGAFTFGSWWKFRRDAVLGGKMWLSIASGLGISIGIVLILAVTPQACPPDLPQVTKISLLTTIYLGGAAVGLAYLLYSLLKISINLPAVRAQVDLYAGLLLLLLVARAALLPILFLPPQRVALGLPTALSISDISLLILDSAVLPALGYVTLRAIRSRYPAKALPFLVGIATLGLGVEVLARAAVLYFPVAR